MNSVVVDSTKRRERDHNKLELCAFPARHENSPHLNLTRIGCPADGSINIHVNVKGHAITFGRPANLTLNLLIRLGGGCLMER
jgi:hypothetical protein